MSALRSRLKAVTPRPLRKLLRACLHYVQRVGRWPVILAQLRGATWADELKLIASAAAAPIVSLHRLSAWQDPVLLFDAAVHVRGIGRFDLRRRSDDLWHVLPWREHAIHRTLRARLRDGDTFVDAGANIGIYTVLASRLVGASGRVISIEMMPDTADLLEAHVRLNGLTNVRIVRRALSDGAAKTVTATMEPGKYGQATIAATPVAGARHVTVEIEATTLAAVCAGLPAVQLMKLDLEGVEFQALRGAGDALAGIRDVIYENRGSARDGRSSADALLTNAGYELRRLDGNNRLAMRRGGA